MPTCSSTVIQPRARRVSLSTAPCLGEIPYVAVSIRFEVSRLSGTKGLVPWQDSCSPSPFETAYNSLSPKGSPRSSYKNIPAQPVIIEVQEQEHMTSFSNWGEDTKSPPSESQPRQQYLYLTKLFAICCKLPLKQSAFVPEKEATGEHYRLH